jgi:cytochrome P450
VAAVVRVIGRGEPAGAAADGAAARLLARVGVPGASILYQAHDATAALLLAALTGRPAPPLVTRRRAARATAVGDRALPAGAEVALDLTAAGLGFGAGPHRCPGRAVAEALVAGTLGALAEHRYVVVAERVRYRDGRPSAVPLQRT